MLPFANLLLLNLDRWEISKAIHNYRAGWKLHLSGFLPSCLAMEVTKPYKFIGLGVMEVTKRYQFLWFGAMVISQQTLSMYGVWAHGGHQTF